MRTLDDLEIGGKRVLVRVDFNVPMSDPPTPRITDDTRIRAALPTIAALRERGASQIILCAHLGRPKGERDPALSLAPVAARLGELLGVEVPVAPTLERDNLPQGEVVMLENVRYEPGETKDDPDLAARYAALADVYVNDAFGAAHRAHASTHGVATLLPSAAGLLLQREVETLMGILKAPEHPLVAIVGGAKVTDKIGVIDAFLDRADAILIGGAMCFPFFRAQGHTVGSSLCEEAGVAVARRALDDAAEKGCRLLLPSDLVLGESFSADTPVTPLDGIDVPDGLMGLDVGPCTAEAYAAEIVAAGTVFWNGPMGAFELAPFAAGTKAVAEAVARCEGTTVVGGGDSAAALAQFGYEDRVTHLSTGGGASLELIEGKTLPGVDVLGGTT